MYGHFTATEKNIFSTGILHLRKNKSGSLCVTVPIKTGSVWVRRHRGENGSFAFWFQKKNGLTADGIAGPATLKALGMSSGGGGSSSQQNSAALLARVISAEARGEPYSGQVAVGAVILNRVEHPSFPNTIAGVVYQPGAFTCMVDGQFNEPVADSAYRAAQDALNGADPSGGAIYYFNPDTATSAWIWSRPLIKTIGKHRFCA